MNTKQAKKLIRDVRRNIAAATQETPTCSIRQEVWSENVSGLDGVSFYIEANSNNTGAQFIDAQTLPELTQELRARGYL